MTTTPKSGKSAPKAPKPARCPICGKPSVPEHRPFCSARCRAIDLGHWFGENYKLPTDEAPFTDSE